MATNDMYRQLLSQAVSKNGSALIGGNSGGAMMGGYFDRKKPKPKGTGNPDNIAKGLALQTPALIRKRQEAQNFRTQYIDAKLYEAYGNRDKISYNERADVINAAKKDLHARKLAIAQSKREAMTPQEKAAAKQKAQIYRANAIAKAGFDPNTAEGRKGYRLAKGIVKSPQEKAVSRAVNSDPRVKAAKAAARAEMRGPAGPRAYAPPYVRPDSDEKKHE